MGYWIKIADLCGIEVLKCSVCGEEHPRKPSAFCPDCGVKMEQKVKILPNVNPCPICGAKVRCRFAFHIRGSEMETFYFVHPESDCAFDRAIRINGRNETEAIKKWNVNYFKIINDPHN